MSVIIETSIGDVTIDLYTDERPRCCLNFLKLCKIKYYNFSLFHTIQENLVAQCGDPTGTGRGGESIFGHLYGDQARYFDMEATPRIKHIQRGLISMVNNGSGMHGSQFVLTLAENLDYLDGKHTVFGEVAEGTEVLDKLNKAFCDEEFRPHQDIRIYHTVILDDPFDDPEGLIIPAKSPGPTQEMLDSDRIACDADIHEDEGITEEELAEMKAEREAKANTQILEMVGDIPDTDIAPPENVLFVCKLNPVTTSEDLEIIFSRFGTIISCDVIKDSKTGESLQYAFIEFEEKEQCETAYFKMDNTLIDDRRIHVDFSQSVSKLKWKGKGRGVDVLPTGDAPAYVLKNQQRVSHGYDLVYEDDFTSSSAQQKPNKKAKNQKAKRARSSSSSEDEKHKKSKEDRGSRDQLGSRGKQGDRRDPHEDRRDHRMGRSFGSTRGRDQSPSRKARRSESPDRMRGRDGRPWDSRERRHSPVERRQKNMRDGSDERNDGHRHNSDERSQRGNRGGDRRERRERSRSEERRDRNRRGGRDSRERSRSFSPDRQKVKRKKRHNSSDDSGESEPDTRPTKRTRDGDRDERKHVIDRQDSPPHKSSKKHKKKGKKKNKSSHPASSEDSDDRNASDSEEERVKRKHKKKKHKRKASVSSSPLSDEDEQERHHEKRNKKKKKKNSERYPDSEEEMSKPKKKSKHDSHSKHKHRDR